jgi:uncharacterized protein YbaR (Trm112 family)
MFIELIDTLRCPGDHPETWLVAAIQERDERIVLEGTLGCPVCHRQYPISRGIAWYGRDPATTTLPTAEAPGDAEGAMRAAAFLAPPEGAMLALSGEWGAYAHGVAALVPVRIFAINPSRAIEESEQVAIVETDQGLPFAALSLRGVALGDNATPRDLGSAVRVLKDGRRLVAPVSLPVPEEIQEIARDERYWVGEKRGALVGLRRA